MPNTINPHGNPTFIALGFISEKVTYTFIVFGPHVCLNPLMPGVFDFLHLTYIRPLSGQPTWLN